MTRPTNTMPPIHPGEILREDFLAPQPERPTPIDSPLTIRATVKEFKGRKAVIESTISADGQPCAKGEVVVVQMPEGWV